MSVGERGLAAAVAMRARRAALLVAVSVGAVVANAGPVTYQAIDLGEFSDFDAQAFGVFDGHQVGVVAEQPAVWSGTPGSLTQFGQDFDFAHAIFGTSIAGYSKTPDFHSHATVWRNLGAGPVIDLHPAGSTYDQSEAVAIAANGVVGNASIKSTPHAAYWSRDDDASTFVDLNPAGFERSFGAAISPTHQVGSGIAVSSGIFHALLWSGSASSVVDLNPQGFAQSQAFGADGDQQVGVASLAGFATHAMVWTGTADSAKDMNPPGFFASGMNAASAGRQAGFGFPTAADDMHAMVWFGTADSAVDLQQFLPEEVIFSEAAAINAGGDVVGWALFPGSELHAFLWVPQSAPPPAIPLPAAAGPGLMTFAAAAFLAARARSRSLCVARNWRPS